MRKGRIGIKMTVAIAATMLVMLCGACGQHVKNGFTVADSKQAYATFLQEQKAAANKYNICYSNNI